MSTDKTLADVQPGGRVRLGDQAERAQWRSMDTCPRDGTVVRLRWGEDHVSPGWWSAPVSPVQNDDGTWPSDTGGFPWAFIDFNNGSAFVNHAVDTEYGPTHWAPYVALSAQPSPGGQDALAALQRDYDKLLDSFNRQVEVAEKIAGRVLQQDDRIEELEEALASRQPVGALPQGCDACDQTGIRQNDEGRNICCPDCDLGGACAGDTRQPVRRSFQAGVAEWMGQCFLPSLYSNMTERGDRLLEEVLELLQAHGYDKARVPTLVNYVFGRPVGEPAQEVGGVMVTLAGYCWVAGLDMHASGDAELARINQPEVMAKIRAKQEAKNALHFDTPLPGNAARQPVGEPFGYCADFDPGAHEFSHTFYYLAPGEKVPEGCTPFFTKQPAQAVDLGQFRDVVADWRDRCCRAADKNTIVNMAKADRLLALIDGKAVGK